jgi:hypothetical protein
MSDNPNIRGPKDSHRVSEQPWEVETIHNHFKSKSHQQVKDALAACERETGSKNREKIMACMKRKLG